MIKSKAEFSLTICPIVPLSEVKDYLLPLLNLCLGLTKTIQDLMDSVKLSTAGTGSYDD